MEELNKELNKLSDDKYLELLYDREERDKEMYESIMEQRLEERNIDIVKNMIDNDLDINTIIKYTGLKQWEIESLFKEYKEDKYLELLHEKEEITQEKIEEKIQIVKNMLNENIDIETISKVTELSVKEIEDIK